jgi:hypothetical protein
MKWRGIAENLMFGVMLTMLIWVITLSALMAFHSVVQ